MIGNGFDIGLGMRTSFKDFFDIYCAKALKKDEDIRQLAMCIATDKNAWSYFERQLGKYTAQFDKDTLWLFYAQIRDFTEEFIKYLKQQEERLSFDDEKLIVQTLQNALTGFYKNGVLPVESAERIDGVFQSYKAEEHRYNFISFNYTDALQRCVEKLKDGMVTTRNYSTVQRIDRVGKIVNVHGMEDHNPIMGVNDVSQIENQKLAEIPSFVDRLVKPRLNARIQMNNEKRAAEILGSSKIICIYGMSLGETDRDWWNRVIAWLNGDSERQLVIFDFDPQYTASVPMNWLDKQDAIIVHGLASHNQE